MRTTRGYVAPYICALLDWRPQPNSASHITSRSSQATRQTSFQNGPRSPPFGTGVCLATNVSKHLQPICHGGPGPSLNHGRACVSWLQGFLRLLKAFLPASCIHLQQRSSKYQTITTSPIEFLDAPKATPNMWSSSCFLSLCLSVWLSLAPPPSLSLSPNLSAYE